MISIEDIYLTDEGDYTRLNADIKLDDEEHTVWYEVEKEYAEYLCSERVDAFVVGLLPMAMAFGHDIVCKKKPISEALYWKLTSIYMPVLSKGTTYYKEISIDCDLDDTVFESFGVGTGFSAGVDSFFTVLKNTKKATRNFNITHVTFFNVGACGSYGGKVAFDRFQDRIGLFKNTIDELGLKLVLVNSNISETVMMSYNYTHTFRSISAVLALQKLFKTYYYSAGYPLTRFSLNPEDSAYFDLLNTTCFGTENTQFFSTGCAESRIEKTKYISEFPITYDVLNVCNSSTVNCRTCEKCIRTMGGLYALGKLNKYEKVFDVPYFNKHIGKNLGFIIGKLFDGTPEREYYSEIISTARKNGKRIPMNAFLFAIPYALRNGAYGLARRNRYLRRMVHKRISKTSGIRFND